MAVPFEKKKKKHVLKSPLPFFKREYCSPLVTIAWQQVMADQSKRLILMCVKTRKRTQKILIVRNALSGSWKVERQLWQIKGGRLTQLSRSRKEQSKQFLERQCVASNSLARTPPPESVFAPNDLYIPQIYTQTLPAYKYPNQFPHQSFFSSNLQNSKFAQPFPQRSPPPFAPPA